MNMYLAKKIQGAQVAFQGFHETAFDTPEAREAAGNLPNDERQRLVENLLVRYPRFELGYAHLSITHMPVKGGTPRKGGVACLMGDTRAGKSWIVKAYMAEFPPHTGEFGEMYPMVYVAATENSTTSTLTDAFYTATKTRAMAPGLNVPTRTLNVLNRMLLCGTQLVVIDDVQYMIGKSRSSKEVSRFTSFVRTLVDSKQFAVQLVGEEDVLFDWMVRSPELSGRGFRREVIKPFDRTVDGQLDFRLLMADIDDRLPFRQSSMLGDAVVAAELYDFSAGYLGRLMEMISEAAWHAISNGDSRILFATLRDKCREMAWNHGQPDYFGDTFMKRYSQVRQ
ncbi:TniB family NTP-binding protein [Rhizobium leguminosarum]|uniref:TniB family NTP-binding protein n=1 Tax=Rhizobium leguminosarum TaxID=384 RepID=UPI0013B7E778|nr:TniB family NTP-binding protein [Rhizobium leguminosarum]NEI62184.1 AAA family ATPase [Rhizobium leguminosarum]